MKTVTTLQTLITGKEDELKVLREKFDYADANHPGDLSLIQQKISLVSQQLDWLKNLEKKMQEGLK